MTAPKRENLWVNLILNVALPSVILTKGDDLTFLNWSNETVLIVALSFPLLYGVYDFIVRRKVNVFSVIGFVSVLITGVVGLAENIPTRWIAVKEAAVPLLFGIAILISSKTKKPLVRSLLFSRELFDVDLIEASLEERGTREQFEDVIRACTIWVVGSFGLSAILNYVLAVVIVKSESPGPELNAEIGRMTALSWPVIALPTTLVMMVALFKLIKGIEESTGHELDDVLHPEVRQKLADKDAKRAEAASSSPPDES